MRSKNSLTKNHAPPVLAIYIGITAAVIWFAVHLGNTVGLGIAFAFISIVIATFFASRSLRMTSQSLELTRATQRPFLNLSRIDVVWRENAIHDSHLQYFIIDINNTGSLPADNVSLRCIVWKTRSKVKHVLDSEVSNASICFPNEEIQNLRFSDTNQKKRLVAKVGGKIQVRIEIDYDDKSTNTAHKTVRSYLTEYNPTARHEPTPIPHIDHWD